MDPKWLEYEIRRKEHHPFPCRVDDWAGKQMRGESILPDPTRLKTFSPKMAEAGWKLYSNFRLTAVPGAPLVRDMTKPWLKDLVMWWMGAQDPVTQARSVQEMMLLVAKKSSKTSSMALLILTQFILSKRPNAEAVIIAPTRQVADMAFRLIHGAIDTTPGLKERYKVNPGQRVVNDLRPGWRTKLQIASADLGVLVGATPQYMMLDEIHVLQEANGAEYLMEHVRGARRGQPDASCIMCTTHSHEIPVATFREELDTYYKIRNGELDIPRVMVDYEFPDELTEKIQNGGGFQEKHVRKYWHMVNPNMGQTASYEETEEDMRFHKSKGLQAFGGWLNQFANLKPEYNAPPNAWPGAYYWMDCVDKNDPVLGDPTIKGLDRLLERSEIVAVGVDGGGLFDLLSLYVIGREMGRGRWLGWGHSWIHTGVEKAYPNVWSAVQPFINKGELTPVDYRQRVDEEGKRSFNLDQVSRLVSYINSTGKLMPKHGVGIDTGGMATLADALLSESLPAPLIPGPTGQLASITQGVQLSSIHLGLADKVAAGTFLHGDQEIMRWAVNNVVMVQKGMGYAVEKEGLLPAKKIDPYVAMACAARCLEQSPQSAVTYGLRSA